MTHIIKKNNNFIKKSSYFLIFFVIFFTIFSTNYAFAESKNLKKNFVSDAKVLKKSDIKSELINIQNALNQVLIPSPEIKVTGVFDSKTIEAIKTFQESRNLDADGIAGYQTRVLLRGTQVIVSTEVSDAKVLKKSDIKSELINIQNALNQVLIPSPEIKVTGVFDSKTIEAIKTFQESRNLDADGIAGYQTRVLLKEAQVNLILGNNTSGSGTSNSNQNNNTNNTNNNSNNNGNTNNGGNNNIVISGGGGGGGVLGGGGHGGGYIDPTQKTITSFSFNSPSANGIISGTDISINVPFGTNVTTLTPSITLSGGTVSPSSGAVQDFTNPVTYTVTAIDGSSKIYTVTVTVLPPSPIATVTSASYIVSTGGTSSETITNVPYNTSKATFEAAIAKGEPNQTWVDTGIHDPVLSNDTLVVTAQNGTTVVTYTITALLNPAKDISSFNFSSPNTTGIINGNNINLNVPFGTNVTALVPTITITGASVSPTSGTAQNFTNPVNYIVTALDSSVKVYTVTVIVGLNPAKDITSFDFTNPGATGVINGNNISVTVPFGTNVTALVPTITITGASVSPTSGTAQNFTNPVNYTVTALDSSTKVYTVTVNVALNTAKAITGFNFNGLTPVVVGNINEGAKTISLSVPYNTNVTALVPTITITGASVSPTSGTAQNFTNSVTYTVTAANSSTQDYTVTVTVLPPSPIATVTSTSYIVSTGGTSSETITNVPFNTSKATFKAAISKGEPNQTWVDTGIHDPVLSNDTLVVTAQDGTTVVTYTVTVNVDPDIAKVAADKAALVDGVIQGANSNLSNITVHLTNPLLAAGSVYGSGITWVSSNTSVVSNNGQIINRPAFGSGNSSLTLTATITRGAVTDTKIFNLIVLQLPASNIATVTSTLYTISAGGTSSETIMDVPVGTSKATFEAAIAKGEPNQTWVDTGIHDPVLSNDTLVVTAQNGTTVVTYTVAVGITSLKQITAFNIPSQLESTINQSNHTILVTMPYNTNVTALVPSITINGASVLPTSGIAQNFTNPVNYTVTAINSSTQIYIVTVIVNPWLSYAAPEQNFWSSVAYGNGTYVAVAPGGTHQVMTSSDGMTWIPQTAAEANSWKSIAYGNGTFVAVASNGTHQVMTSSDGMTWIPQTAAEANSWNSVTYGGNSRFVAVASSGTHRVMISSDNGATWAPINVYLSSYSWNSVTYGNGTFVAVASSGQYRVMKSTDGSNWSAISAAEDNSWNSVTYGNGIFVAIASDGAHQVMISSDNGATWTPESSTNSNGWDSVAYGNGVFVAVSQNANHRIMVSPDGINWTYQLAGDVDNQACLTSITYGSFGNFVSVANFGGTHRIIKSLQGNILSPIATVTSASYIVSTGGTSSETITNVPYNTSKATFEAAIAKGEPNQTWVDTGIHDPVLSNDTLVVTAQNGTTVVTYTTTVLPPSNIATITSAGTYVVSAEGGTAEVITNVPSSTSKATFLAGLLKGEPNQTWVNTIGTNVATGDTLEVTAQDGTTFITYTVILAADSCAGTPSITYGGKIYYTVQIGTQCWLQKNLNIGTKIADSVTQTNNATTEKYCYNNLESNCDTYGGLYQWDEAMQYVNTEGAQGICPSGWHIPSKTERDTLSTYLGGVGLSGKPLKEKGLKHWNFATNMDGSNTSGFTSVGTGYLYGSFSGSKIYSYFLTSTLLTGNLADGYYGNQLSYNSIGNNPYGYYPQVSSPVRCMKNTNLSPNKAITSFNFNGLTPAVTGTVNEGAKTVSLTVPYSTNLTNLVPTIVHTGVLVSPASGAAHSFTNGIASNYTVTAEDNSTQVYAVTVTKSIPSNIATITSGTYTVSAEGSSAEVITNVPSNTPKATFELALTKGESHQSWVDTGISNTVATGDTLEVTAEDGTTFVTYTVILAADSCPGTPSVSYGGKTYYTVQIGTQCWLQKNLNVGTRVDNTVTQTNNATTEKYCYNNDEANCTTYGGLYQWDEAMQYALNEGSQGICPSGWHIPTNTEIGNLRTYLGGYSVAGGKIKEKGLKHWNSPNEGGSNSSGFTGLPAGERWWNGSFVFATLLTDFTFWTSTLDPVDQTSAYQGGAAFSTANFDIGEYYKPLGVSIRCLSNSTTPLSAPTGVTATAGIAQATVTFSPPASNGGSPITGYTVTSNPAGGTDSNAGTTSLSHVVTGLTNGTAYTFTVIATNANGQGPTSDPSNSVTPSLSALVIGDSYQGGKVAYILQAGDPGYIADGQVRGLIAPISDQSTGAQWGCSGTATGATGTVIGTGNSNTGAIVSVCTTSGIAAQIANDLVLNGYSDWYLPSADELKKVILNKALIGGFSGNNRYWSSTETDGYGAQSQKENLSAPENTGKGTPYYVRAVRTFSTATVPNAPTIGTATAGDGQASVTFTAPASNGGSAILDYTVTSNTGGFHTTGNSSPLIVSGLTNGQTYTFTVVARNAIGTGPASGASNSVTPVASSLPTPTFSPNYGPVILGVSTITIASVGADHIFYTTDGSTPNTTNSTVMMGSSFPIVILSTDHPIKALAANGNNTVLSEVGISGTYTKVMARIPTSVHLTQGGINPVTGVVDVSIPVEGGTDTTGVAMGWVTGTADRIKFSVGSQSGVTTVITANGNAYTSGNDYIISAVGPVTFVVTDSEAGESDAITTFVVTVLTPSSPQITSFTIPSQLESTINEGTHTIKVTMPYGTNLNSLAPTIIVTSGATVSPLSGALNNFINPTNYLVTGSDLSTQIYTVTVQNNPWVAYPGADTAGYWTGVTYGNGLFVAVDHNGIPNKVMTSSDGATWTAYTGTANYGWSSVTYGNGLFVAVGDNNIIMTSDNGSTWTDRTPPTGVTTTIDWSSVTYGNGLFVAVASDSSSPNASEKVMTSTNGIDWTARTAAEANSWYGVTYGNGLFVAVAGYGTHRVMTSINGIDWTARTAAEANSWYGVTYDNGLFVAVGGAASQVNRIMTSTNGIDWTARTAAEENQWTSVTYGNGLFVAVAATGTHRVMTSPDGINWSLQMASDQQSGFGFRAVTYSTNGKFVAVGRRTISPLECVIVSIQP